MLARLLLGASLLLPAPASSPASEHRGEISGTIVDERTDEPIEHALVILQCACLPGTRETQTNAEGQYRFSDLPAGTYTVQVLFGQTDVSKIVTLTPRKPD